GFGGLTSLGVDVVDIAFPGVILGLLARPWLASASPARVAAIGGGVAALAVIGTAACVSAALALSSADYLPSLRIIAITYVPLALAEAVITGFAVSFLMKVKPEVLGLAHRPGAAS
ncbi:MAG: cobalamin biosynthesis protein CbiM, partial [Phyllobacteriaceae bacterium]|nr:cobalamin biosynthesis protein CbiM [Phyllobacteriaceae bacterium]